MPPWLCYTPLVTMTMPRSHTQDDRIIGYQIAFDLYESATQHFLRKVQETIHASLPVPPTAPPTTAVMDSATTSATTEASPEQVSVPVQESGN